MYNKAVSRKMVMTMILFIVLAVMIGVLVIYTVLRNVQAADGNAIQLDEAHMRVFEDAGFVLAGEQGDSLMKEDEKMSIGVFLNGTKEKEYPYANILILGDGEEILSEEILYNAQDDTLTYTIMESAQLKTMELNAKTLRVNNFDISELEMPGDVEEDDENNEAGQENGDDAAQAEKDEAGGDDQGEPDPGTEEGTTLNEAEQKEAMKDRLSLNMVSFYATFGFSIENMLGQDTPEYVLEAEEKKSFGYQLIEAKCEAGENAGEFVYASEDGNRDILLHPFTDPSDESDSPHLTVTNKNTDVTSTIDAMKNTLRCTYYEGVVQYYIAYDFTTSTLLLIRQNGNDITGSYKETATLREQMRTTYQSEEEYVRSIFGFGSDMLLRSSDPVDFAALQAEIDTEKQLEEVPEGEDGENGENGEDGAEDGENDDGGTVE